MWDTSGFEDDLNGWDDICYPHQLGEIRVWHCSLWDAGQKGHDPAASRELTHGRSLHGNCRGSAGQVRCHQLLCVRGWYHLCSSKVRDGVVESVAVCTKAVLILDFEGFMSRVEWLVLSSDFRFKNMVPTQITKNERTTWRSTSNA